MRTAPKKKRTVQLGPLLDAAIKKNGLALPETENEIAALEAQFEREGTIEYPARLRVPPDHSWVKHEREGWTVCSLCGMVRNYERESPCRGAVKIALREATGGEQGETAEMLEIVRLSEKHLEDSRDSLATIIDEAFGPQEVLPTMSDLLSRLESLLNAQIGRHQAALRERDDLLARLYRAGEERCELRVELDEARAEVASWVEWSDHHSAWKVLTSSRPPPEEIRSELGSYLDDREQHLATLAQTISERDEARADSHRYSTECDMARLERDEARARCRLASQILIEAIGANGPENVDETARRAAAAMRAIQDKRERALVELSRNGCDCECDCVSQYEDHQEDCEPCLACRVRLILGES